MPTHPTTLRDRLSKLEKRHEEEEQAGSPVRRPAIDNLDDRLQALEQAQPQNQEDQLAEILERLRVLEAAGEQDEADTDEEVRERVFEDLRILRQDVNRLMEDNRGRQDPGPSAPTPLIIDLEDLHFNPEIQHGPYATRSTDPHGQQADKKKKRYASPDRLASPITPTGRSSRNTTSRRSAGTDRRSSRRTTHRIKHDDSTDTDSDHSEDDAESTLGEPRNDPMALNIHQRQKGPKMLGLDSLVPSDSRFDRLMSYRYYRLTDTTAARTQDSTTRLHRLLKNIELTMREHKFDGEDPILIFDFLSRAVEEADTLAMNEGQLVICLPHLLTKTAAQRYRSIASRSRDGKMTRWPEAVQYLLRTYGTDRCIQEAVEYFEGLRQATNENEDAFAARVSSVQLIAAETSTLRTKGSTSS